MQIEDKFDRKFLYGFAVIDGQNITMFLPDSSDAELVSQLKARGLNLDLSSILFSNVDQLKDALSIFANRLSYTKGAQFYIASSPAQLSRLQTALSQLPPIKPLPTPPPTATSPSPPAATAPSIASNQPTDLGKTLMGIVGGLMLWSAYNGQHAPSN